ncbi:MAG: hypothetical protein HY927_15600 [Elusimicrobia bacterium]|nr:hypothetical protein [Elusimicrobiota bacterium]
MMSTPYHSKYFSYELTKRCSADNVDVLKWFRPSRGDLQIYYSGEASYEPDFVVEAKAAKFLCEIKRAAEMTDATVLAKARAAAEWCRHAAEHERKHGGKPWSYLLVPDGEVAENKTLQGLAASYAFHVKESPQ